MDLAPSGLAGVHGVAVLSPVEKVKLPELEPVLTTASSDKIVLAQLLRLKNVVSLVRFGPNGVLLPTVLKPVVMAQ